MTFAMMALYCYNVCWLMVCHDALRRVLVVKPTWVVSSPQPVQLPIEDDEGAVCWRCCCIPQLTRG
jgi:hypothetical protein